MSPEIVQRSLLASDVAASTECPTDRLRSVVESDDIADDVLCVITKTRHPTPAWIRDAGELPG